MPFEEISESFIRHLCSPDSILQYGMVTYTISIILSIYQKELVSILHKIIQLSENENKNIQKIKSNHMIAILSIIKHCRKQGSLTSLEFEDLIEKESSKIPFYEIIQRGLTSGDPLLRHTTLECICETRSLTEPLTKIEMETFSNFLRFCIRDSIGTQGIHEAGILLQKLMVKYKSNLRNKISNLSYKEEDSKQLNNEYNEFLNFINQSTNQILLSIYPRAPFVKISLAIYLYNQLILDVWRYLPPGIQKKSSKPSKTGANLQDFIPNEILSKMEIFSLSSTQNLLLSVWESFERTRELLFDTIQKFPVPLPSLTFSEFTIYLQSAKALITSSRARNGEIGAIIIRICYFKYLKELKSIDNNFTIMIPQLSNEIEKTLHFSFSIVHFGSVVRLFSELLFLLEEKIQNIKKYENDTEKSYFERSSMHGILCTIQHLSHDVRFNTFISSTNVSIWREIFSRLLNDLFEILNLAMSVIADVTTEGWKPKKSSSDSEFNDDDIDMDDDVDDDDDNDEFKGTHKVIVGSWLLIKSVSLLLGNLIKEIPLQINDKDEKYILTNNQVQISAEKLLFVLLSTRHKGVLEKTYIGFELICSRIFESSITELLQYPPKWLDILLDRITNSANIITRRSAGIPFAVNAILRSEARQSLNIQPYLNSIMDKLISMIINPCNSNIDEMSIVHSFNVLRSILKDKILGSLVDSWIAKYFEATIDALSHSSWAIRNVASLSFSVLLIRTLGVSKRNVEERSRSTSTTFSILFSRLTPMYPYLIKKFDTLISEWKNNQNDNDNNTSNQLFITQTSLFSLLVLLSRLSPSERVLNSNSVYDSKPFIPFVLQCSSHSDYRVREMAARSLVPLIICNDVIPFILSQVKLLPFSNESYSDTISSFSLNLNHVHGILLQIYYLYKESLPLLHTTGVKVDTQLQLQIENVADKFSFLFYLMNLENFVITDIFFNVLILIENSFHIFEINSKKTEEFKKQMIISAYKSLSTQSNIPINYQPMRYTLRKNLISFCCKNALYCSNHFENSLENKLSPSNFIIEFINDPDYEIRSELYQQVYNSINKLTNNSLEWKKIQECLLLRFFIEQNEETSSILLQLITKIPLSLPENILYENSTHWQHLISLMKNSPSSLVQQQVLKYMGYFIHQQLQISNKIDDKQNMIGCFQFWLSELEKYAISTEPMEFRSSVVDSIIESKLLEMNSCEENKNFSEIIVRCWILFAVLLEDDDEDIRDNVIEYLSFHTNLPLYSPVKWKNQKQQNNIQIIIETSLSPSVAKESIYLLLYKHYFDNIFFQKYLFENVCLDKIQQELPTWESHDQKLFTKELDNMWEEPLFQTHISSFILSKLIKEEKFDYSIIDDCDLLFRDSMKRLLDLAKSYSSVSSEIMAIPPFADQTRFLYINQLFVALYCVGLLKISKITPESVEMFTDSVKLLDSSLLHPIAKHSFAFVIDCFNENILDSKIQNTFACKKFYGVDLFFTCSL